MSISFNEVPANSRIPAVYVEYDNSNALQALTTQPYKLLVIGQRTSAGTQAALTPITVSSAEQAKTLFGPGSVSHLQAKAVFASSSLVNATFVAFDDPTSGVLATGDVDFAGTATAAGTVNLYIGGDKVAIAVASGDTAAEVATAMIAAVNANTSLPVTALIDGSDNTQMNLTAKCEGTLGNDIDIRLNYNTGEALPAGITATITAMASGAGVPDLDSLWAVLGETHYNVIAFPWTDDATLTDLEAELADRAGAIRQIEAVAFTCQRGSLSTIQTLGNSRNSQFVVIVSGESSPRPGYRISAEIAKIATLRASNDPAQPIQNVALVDTLAPALTSRFTETERNTLLFDGVASFKVGAGDIVYIERLVTSYQENAQGADDTSYLDVETLFTLSYIRYDIRTYFATKYPNHKLANDGTRYGSGQKVLTPKVVKAECVARFTKWEEAGLVEDVAQFKEDLVVERNSGDPNRLDVLLPVNLINQLRQTAIQISFTI